MVSDRVIELLILGACIAAWGFACYLVGVVDGRRGPGPRWRAWIRRWEQHFPGPDHEQPAPLTVKEVVILDDWLAAVEAGRLTYEARILLESEGIRASGGVLEVVDVLRSKVRVLAGLPTDSDRDRPRP